MTAELVYIERCKQTIIINQSSKVDFGSVGGQESSNETISTSNGGFNRMYKAGRSSLLWNCTLPIYSITDSFFLVFFSVRLCRFCVVIRFFHPRHNGQWPPTSKDFYPRLYPLHLLFSYLSSWEIASISLFNVECQTRELLVPFW